MNYLISFSTFILLLFFLQSCSESPDQSLGQEIIFEDQEIFTRSTTRKIESNYYHLNSLAAFERGKSKLNLEQVANWSEKEISLVVLYESSAPWASVFAVGKYNKTGDDQLNDLLSHYDLTIIEQFEIDATNEGIVLEGNSGIQEPLEVARKLSLVDFVMMVEVKEVPSAQPVYEETAEN
jgi:hypothetical protein